MEVEIFSFPESADHPVDSRMRVLLEGRIRWGKPAHTLVREICFVRLLCGISPLLGQKPCHVHLTS